MSELKIEHTTAYFENDSQIKDVLEQNTEIIKSLLERKETKLGEGNTANVHYLGSNRKICLKVYKNPQEIPTSIFYNDLKKEMDFLVKLQDINDPIRVPKPYSTLEYKGTKCLVMEALDAYSLRDVMDGKADLPDDFNIDNFFDNLNTFVYKMHEEGIHHGDLLDGNVMYNPVTKKIYVIDFGQSIKIFGDENPHIREGARGLVWITKDEDRLTEVYKLLKEHITKNKNKHKHGQ